MPPNGTASVPKFRQCSWCTISIAIAALDDLKLSYQLSAAKASWANSIINQELESSVLGTVLITRD
jgi:hypothetical protein